MKIKALMAEFIGTFTLIFIGVGSIAANELTNGSLGLTGIALAHGLAIAVMISATMAVSGGHLNPAVTIGCIVTRKIDAYNGCYYILFQCLGALVAAALIQVCLPVSVLKTVNMGTPALGAGITPAMGFVTEIILTFFLVFVVFGTAVDARAPKVGGLFIGLTVALDIMMGGPISGGAMNPARHFGPALMGGGLENIWLYWLGPFIGGICAAVTYNKFLMEKA